jgi:hypothetical protein
LPGVSSVQVDLVLGAIQPETDSTVSLAAVEVIDERVCTFWAMAAPFIWPTWCMTVDNLSQADG